MLQGEMNIQDSLMKIIENMEQIAAQFLELY